MTDDDERIAYLAGDGSAPLDDAERRHLDELKDLLADPALWAEPGPDLEDLVVAAVAQEATSLEARPPAAAATTPVAEPSRPPRRLASRWVAGAVAVAAAILVAVALSLPEDRSTPEPLAATLVPSELAPGAHGQVTLARTDSGWRIELDATGLPRLDAGRFYQAWLKRDDGVTVAIGTFNEGQDVVLWAGVSPRDFPTITITEESADGDPASSGRVVLSGPVTEG